MAGSVRSAVIDELCVVCKRPGILKSLYENYRHKNGKIGENYLNMINKCSKVQWPSKRIKGYDKICKCCVIQLRDALKFLRRVNEAYKQLIPILAQTQRKNERTPVKIKEPYSMTKSTVDHKRLSPVDHIKLSPVDNIKLSPKDHIKLSSVDPIKLSPVDPIKLSPVDPIKLSPVDHINLSPIESQVGDSNDLTFDCGVDGIGEDSHVDSNESVMNEDDDKWSVTTDDMNRATGYNVKKPEKRFEIPRLDKSFTACPVCSAEYESYYILLGHYKEHYPDFLCHICGKSFVLRNKFKVHMDKYKEEKYKCQICDKEYLAKDSLSQHVKRIHQNMLLYKCNCCGERFDSNKKKKLHLNLVHGADFTGYCCKDCGKEFDVPARLQSHVDRVHLQILKFHCDECGKAFSARNNLTQHKKTHQNPQHPCKHCTKNFTSRNGLRTHLLIHQNIKNFKCTICDAAFIQGSSLKWHMKSHQ